MSHMRAGLALLVGLGALVIAVACAEGWARAGETGAVVRVDTPVGVKYGVADSREARGWRPGMTPSPARAAPRVVFVGDSVTHGVGVQDLHAWPAQVGRALALETVNLAVNGWDAGQVASLVEAEVGRWTPDALVWGVYVNDGMPTRVIHGVRARAPIYVDTEVDAEARLLPDAVSAPLLRRSALFRRVQAVWWVRHVTRQGFDVAWFGAHVERVARWGERSGVPVLAVALAPHVAASDHACRRALGPICEVSTRDLATVEAALSASGLAWVGTLTELRAGGYAPADGSDPDHPGVDGHAVYARAVAPALASLLARADAARAARDAEVRAREAAALGVPDDALDGVSASRRSRRP